MMNRSPRERESEPWYVMEVVRPLVSVSGSVWSAYYIIYGHATSSATIGRGAGGSGGGVAVAGASHTLLAW